MSFISHKMALPALLGKLTFDTSGSIVAYLLDL
jgi:hypothetical protein